MNGINLVIIAASLVVTSACSDGKSNKTDLISCRAAKDAAVAARLVYDKDYEARNPGAESARLYFSDLNACRLSTEGTFVGKWKGQRWRFVPLDGDRYSENPKEIWISDEPSSGEKRIWFSEWRSVSASIERAKQLDQLILNAKVVE